MKLMLDAAKEHPEVFQEKPAVARLSNFGDSSLDFSLFLIQDIYSKPKLSRVI